MHRFGENDQYGETVWQKKEIYEGWNKEDNWKSTSEWNKFDEKKIRRREIKIWNDSIWKISTWLILKDENILLMPREEKDYLEDEQLPMHPLSNTGLPSWPHHQQTNS